MREETIFEMTSPCRDSFRIRGYRFGEGAKTLAIVGAMRGDEVQQQYRARAYWSFPRATHSR